MKRKEVLPKPAHWYRMTYCSYCVHERQAHTDDGPCQRCVREGNGFWPLCPGFTRQATKPEEHELLIFPDLN